jgi:hypothetical protein
VKASKKSVASKRSEAPGVQFWPAIGPIGEDGTEEIFWPDTDGCDPHTFVLRTDEKGAVKGKLIATVTMNPRFDRETVERFSWLFSTSPEQWRMLRTLAASCNDLDSYRETIDALRTLFNAGCINPISDLENERWVNKGALDSFPLGEPAFHASIAKGDAK